MTIETIDRADPPLATLAQAIQAAALAADGTAPFGEQAVLSWSRPDAEDRHLISRDAAGEPIGYAWLDGDGCAELAVRPDHRRQGHGRALVARLEEESGPGLRIWSHGDGPAARALAGRCGYVVVRELRQLRREMDAEPADAAPPAGVTLRAFVPGVDDENWLALNARAFAHHPEQGRMTQADLDARIAEPWFDPAGFLIAERDGEMVGFHWTKVHPGGLGEVYVLGVDPDAHGGGLGRALTVAGLRSLYRRGLRTVLLYVEADNAPALALYHRVGFTTWSRDVMYAAPSTI